jgi:protein O-mannosyl-transferase
MRRPLRSQSPAAPAQGPAAENPTPGDIPVRRVDWTGLIGCAILAAGAVAVYGRTFSVPLLLDDKPSIADNMSIHRLWPLWPALTPPNNAGVGGRPLLNLSYAVNYAFGGDAVFGYHLVNLIIHVLAGWTLFALVRRTLRRPILAERFGPAATPLALAVSALWTWHPVQTESVTYLSQRAESLMGLFYLLTLYCFVCGAEADNKTRRRGWFSFSALACLAGVATKEVMVTAPVMVFLYDRTFIAGGFREAWRRHWPLYLALAASWIPLGLFMTSLHERGVGFGEGVAWWVYGLTECQVIMKYLLLALWPHGLVFDYGMFAAVPLSGLWPDVVALGTLLTLVIVALRRWPATGFAACWYFLILAPTSSIIPVVGQPMAENRLYLPLAGVVVFAVLGVFALAGRRSLAVFAVVAAGLGLASAERNQDYRSEQGLWSDTVAKRPNNERAHNNLGLVLSRIPGRLGDAIAQYEAALRLKPDFEEAHLNLGVALSSLPGRLDDAIAEFRAALRLQPDDFEARSNLGAALAQMPDRLNDAIAEYQAALRLQPDHAEVHNNLGIALANLPGRLNDAIAEFEAAVRLNPDYAEAHNSLGNAFAQTTGRLNDAIAQYEAAVRLNPDYFEAHANLGVILAQTPGRLGNAIAQYEAALRLKPDNAPGWHNLGAARFQAGNLPEAAAAFREELRLSPNDPAAQQALASALQQAGGH